MARPPRETRVEWEALEDLDISDAVDIDFEVGDTVVYPHHGAGRVLKKEVKKMFGEEREYLTIKILHNDMTVMVPCENAGIAGLRRVIDEESVKKVLTVLQDELSEMPKNWNRRFKHNRDKIKTGDIYELAEVVRNLAIREHDKGLSTGEKQMFTRAVKLLASEFMYALEMSEEDAEGYVEALLAKRWTTSAPVQESVATQETASVHHDKAPAAPQQGSENFWRLIGRGDALSSDISAALAELALAPQRADDATQLSAAVRQRARDLIVRADGLEAMLGR